MQLNQVVAFITVIKQKSFTKAAEMLFLTQPTISAQIGALEKELNVQLVVRSTKEVYPSKAGEVFFAKALEIQKAVDNAMMSLSDFSSQVCGTLDIAASTVPAQYIIPAMLAEIRGEFPDVFFSIQQHDSAEAVKQIINLSCEVGIVGTVVEKNKCVYEEFTGDRLVIITPNTEKYSKLNGVFTMNMLKTEPFLLRESGSGTRKTIEEFFVSIGVDHKKINIAAQMYGTEGIKQSVANGVGVSIISEIAARDFVETGRLLKFDFDSDLLNRKFYLAYLKNAPLSMAAKEFVDFVKAKYK